MPTSKSSLATTSTTEKTLQETVEVDPGQVLCVTARFPGNPQRILFSYLAPGAWSAVRDLAFGEPGSKIERVDDGTYRRLVDTRGMRSGQGWWYFSSENDPDPLAGQRARVGRFTVRYAPRALVGGARLSTSQWVAVGVLAVVVVGLGAVALRGRLKSSK